MATLLSSCCHHMPSRPVDSASGRGPRPEEELVAAAEGSLAGPASAMANPHPKNELTFTCTCVSLRHGLKGNPSQSTRLEAPAFCVGIC